jgi:hypothetical protein
MVSERNLPRLPVDGGVGIGFVGVVDNPDTSHDTARSASALLITTFSSENNYTLVCGDLRAYLRAGIEPILRRSISPAEPLWCLIGALTIHTGKGVTGKT